MRTIKFRAWDKKEKRWMNDNEFDILPDGTVRSWYGSQDDMGGELWDVREDVELVQFTGLTDKNGKEIYEGDILRAYRFTRKWRDRPENNEEMHFEVIWSDDWRGFKVKYPKMGWEAYLGADAPYDIIGNIYENKDLLV